MPFVKLDCGVLDSSLWVDRPSREIFITALLMAVPHEIDRAVPELRTRFLEPTGFKVPAGWYGLVMAAGPGIVNRALLEPEDGMRALEKLAQPDPESRSQAFEGRRMVRINGGFLILNYDKYREKDYSAADRMRRYRRRKKMEGVDIDSVHRNVYTVHRNVTQAEAEAEGKPRVRGRAIALTPDFELTDAQVAYARGKGILDVPRELEAFKAHHLAHGKVMKDWGAAWRTWCLNFEKFGGKSSGKESRKLSATERVRQRSRSRIAEIDAELAQREADAGTMDPDGGHLRLPMGESVRGSR